MALFPRREPIRVTILTGFLGAGKTTLLNRLLADPAVVDTAVIVNELGAVGIDHLLVETAADGLIELSGGCLCCTVRGDLADTLADLAERARTGRIAPLKRVVIETTGVAEPAPILALLAGHPTLPQSYALDGVVTVVDALAGLANLEARGEARRQVAVADRLVLTKTDLGDGRSLERLRSALAALNPRAPILDAASGEADAAALLRCGPFDPGTGSADIGNWLRTGGDNDHSGRDPYDHVHVADRISSFSVVRDASVAEAALFDFLDILGSAAGAGLLRMKAIVRTRERPDRPLVLHGVRGFLHPPVRLAAWPKDMTPSTRFVVIGEGLDGARLGDLLAAFAGEARVDAPDYAALTGNPLAIPGFRTPAR